MKEIKSFIYLKGQEVPYVSDKEPIELVGVITKYDGPAFIRVWQRLPKDLEKSYKELKANGSEIARDVFGPNFMNELEKRIENAERAMVWIRTSEIQVVKEVQE